MSTIWTYTCETCHRVWRLSPPIVDQDGAHRDRVNQPCSGRVHTEPIALARPPRSAPAADEVIAPEEPTAA